jgi:hypothetical protein
MLKSNDGLTKSLYALQDSTLPTVDRLRLEMYLLRMKLNLIDFDVVEKCNHISDQEMEDLYEEIRYLCSGEVQANEIRAVTLRLQALAESKNKP